MRDISSSEIAAAAGQPEHRAWNLLMLSNANYRPESRTRCEAENCDAEMPQAFFYSYTEETADAAIAELADIVTKLGESADALYTVDDLAAGCHTARFVVKDRLNVGWQKPNAECAWPVMFAPDGEPLFDGVVLEILLRREGR